MDNWGSNYINIKVGFKMIFASRPRQRKKTMNKLPLPVRKIPVWESLVKAVLVKMTYLRQSLEGDGSSGIDLLHNRHAWSHHCTIFSDTTPIAHFESWIQMSPLPKFCNISSGSL